MARHRGARLRAALNSRVITPDDAGYDEARSVFYGGIDRHPAARVPVAVATQVCPLIVLALSQMKNLEIDTEGRTALAQTGLTAGEYTTAAGAHGLATGFGATRPSFARTLAGLLDGSRGCGPAGSVAVNLGIVDSMQERQRKEMSVYEIRVKGHLDPSWSEWFDGLQVTNEPNGEALLSGCIADQAALHGVLAKVRDLNLQLISVTSVASDHQESSGEGGAEG